MVADEGKPPEGPQNPSLAETSCVTCPMCNGTRTVEGDRRWPGTFQWCPMCTPAEKPRPPGPGLWHRDTTSGIVVWEKIDGDQ